MKPLQQSICLITGATQGIGKITAIELAKKGFTVIFAARDAGKAETVKREISDAVGRNDVHYIIADLRSLKEVRSLADTFQKSYPRLDVLINNAGVFPPARRITEDGFEFSYQVNYLSHFLLTHLLLEQLGRSEQGRIINLSSSVHSMGKFDPNNLQSEEAFSVIGTYAASKLFMLLFTIELAEKLADTRITANALHPGIVRTQMMLGAPGVFRLMAYLSLPFSVSPEHGAETSVYLATSPDVSAFSGEYFVKSKPAAIKSKFNTPEIRALLWNISAEGAFGSLGVPIPEEL
jgi:retinol dehydrogenase 12